MPDTAEISRSARPGSRSHRKISPLFSPFPNARKANREAAQKDSGRRHEPGKPRILRRQNHEKIRDLRHKPQAKPSPLPNPTSGTRLMRALASRDKRRIEANNKKCKPGYPQTLKNSLEMPTKAPEQRRKSRSYKQYHTHIHGRRRKTIRHISRNEQK